MSTVVKQVAGIDVAQKELVVCLGRMYDDWRPELYAHKVFPNTEKGIESCVSWVEKYTDASVEARFVMEATGVYHERFAYYLEGSGKAVSIVLPNKISNYMRTLDIRTVTDKSASRAIALFGLERSLAVWKSPKESYHKLRQLTRERDQLVTERVMLKNFLHAEHSEAHPNQSSIHRLDKRMELLGRQEKELLKEIAVLVAADEEISEKAKLITSIPGIALLTAAIILSETNGFELIENRRQLASYAGFDVKTKESGTSVRGAAHISKKETVICAKRCICLP